MKIFARYFLIILVNAFIFSVFSLFVDVKPVYADARSSTVEAEMQAMAAIGARGFLYWQYSHELGGPGVFGQDEFSFYLGDDTCQALANNAGAFDWVGVNVPNLFNSGAADQALAYLQSCGVNMVRVFGSPDRNGNDPIARQIADLAYNTYGIRLIVVICDFANTCELGIDGNVRSNPTNWYAGGYRSQITGPNYVGSYYSYAQDLAANFIGSNGVYAYELLNEPHCGGLGGCLPFYAEWAADMAAALKSVDSSKLVGIGQMSGQPCTLGDSALSAESPADFTVSNDNPNIDIASGHYYTITEKNNMALASQQAAALGKLFYIGEFGVRASGALPTGNYSDTSCEWPVVIKGRVRSTRKFVESDGTETLNKKLTGVSVTAYQGSWDYGTGKRNAGHIVNSEATVFTDENGNFELTTYRTPDSFDNSNYIAFCAFGEPKEILKVSLDHDIQIYQPINLDVEPLPGGLPQVPCPGDLSYVDRVEYLTCNEQNFDLDGFTNTPSVVYNVELLKEDVDDSYIGAPTDDPDCDPATQLCPPQNNEVTSKDPLEGRNGVYNSTDATSYYGANYLLTGYGYNYRDDITPPRNETIDEEELPLCRRNAACTYPIALEENEGRNGQTCGGPAVGGAGPFEWEERYGLMSDPSAVPACETDSGGVVMLDQIQPPWDDACDDRLAYDENDPNIPGLSGYSLDCRYFPVALLYNEGGALEKTYQTKEFNEATNDSFINNADPVWRIAPFEDGTKADRPFFGLNYVVHPAGPQGIYSLPWANILYSNQAVSHTQWGGPPSMIWHSPFQVQCIDSTEGNAFNPDTELPQGGNRGWYRIGLQQSLCTYNHSTGSTDPTNEEWFIRDETHRGSEGYKYLTEEVPPIAQGLFFNESIFGAVLQFFANLLSVFGVWGNDIPANSTCNPYTWGSWSGGGCPADSEFPCENSCTLDGPPCTAGTCSCSDYGVSASAVCEDGDYSSVPDGFIVTSCTHRSQDEPQGYGEDGDTACLGDIETDLDAYTFVEARRGIAVGKCSLEVVLPFAPPQELEPLTDIGSIMTLDQIASNEKDPPQGQGRGADSGAAGPEQIHVWGSMLRNAVQDPVHCESDDPEECINDFPEPPMNNL
ncbi:MAG: cellulase family glycosylhydrolase [Patescibacteria group bacterium]